MKLGKRKVQSNYTKDVCFSEDTRAKDNVGGVLDLPKKKTFLQFRVDCWKNYC